MKLEAEYIIKKLNLIPLELEGGFYRRTYTCEKRVGRNKRSIGSAIYYLITKNDFSALHQLVSSDEIFHFYYGDPVEMLLLDNDGNGEVVTMSNEPGGYFHPQQKVPKGTWQGMSLKPGGTIGLLGVTVTPAFHYRDFVLGDRNMLVSQYPRFKEKIIRLTRIKEKE
ncbi:MAG: cupin domain-containing protein [Candidatus Marinimicrobia bacterium]|nr:cupin domain-containing protein [Candidatus Neomarinimicrobiota bacterium]